MRRSSEIPPPPAQPPGRDMVAELRQVRQNLFAMKLDLTVACADLERARVAAQQHTPRGKR